MVCGCTFKALLVTLLVTYTSYLLFYKCEQLTESQFEHEVKTILHPINHGHNQLCDGLSKAQTFLTPYGKKTQAFLDENVHSTEFFQKYQIHEKMVCCFNTAVTFIHPYAIKVYQVIEILEVHAYDHGVKLYEQGLQLYDEHVAPKLK